MHWHRVLRNSHSFLLSSPDTVCILSLLLFLARYINIVYLLYPQLSACMPIKLDPSQYPPGCVSQLCCFGDVNSIPLNQVQCDVKAGFGLFTHRKLFFIYP
jgi:hypothetical protein